MSEIVAPKELEGSDDARNIELIHKQEGEQPLLTRRWVVLFSFSFLTFIDAAAWMTFCPVTNYAMDYYGVDLTAINWFEEIWLAAYIIGIPFTFCALNRSVHWTLFALHIIMFVGQWVRFVAFDNYEIALIGQLILSLCNCGLLAMPPVLASAWFAPSEHFLATTVAEISNFLGAGFGFLLSALVVRSAEDIPNTILIQAWLSAVVMVLYFIVGRKEPRLQNVKLDVKQGMTMILKDPRLVILLIAGGSGIGLAYTLLGLMQELLISFDVDNVSVGFMGLILVVCGFITGIVWSFVVKKTHKLESPIRTVPLTAIVGLLGICLVLRLESIWIFGIFLAITGIGIIGFMPLAIEASIERLNHENLVTTVLFTWAQLSSLVETPFVQFSSEWFGFNGFWVMMAISFFTFTALAFSYKKPKDIGVKDQLTDLA